MFPQILWNWDIKVFADVPVVNFTNSVVSLCVQLFWHEFFFTSASEGERGCVFTLFCLFVTCKIKDFSSILVRRFCYSVCLSHTGHNFKPIFMKLHHMVEFVSPFLQESLLFLRSKGQHRLKVNNLSGISKILNFHPTDVKFEEDIYFRSLTSTTNYFGGPLWPKC